MEKLFSYGTLQQEDVQIATFGRVLTTSSDTLRNYALEQLKITDASVVATSGKEFHPIAVQSKESSIDGVVVEITPEELAQSDKYEVKEYRRIAAVLESGITAWVYISSQ